MKNLSKKKTAELEKLLKNYKNPHQHNITTFAVLDHIDSLLAEAHASFVRHLQEKNR